MYRLELERRVSPTCRKNIKPHRERESERQETKWKWNYEDGENVERCRKIFFHRIEGKWTFFCTLRKILVCFTLVVIVFVIWRYETVVCACSGMKFNCREKYFPNSMLHNTRWSDSRSQFLKPPNSYPKSLESSFIIHSKRKKKYISKKKKIIQNNSPCAQQQWFCDATIRLILQLVVPPSGCPFSLYTPDSILWNIRHVPFHSIVIGCQFELESYNGCIQQARNSKEDFFLCWIHFSFFLQAFENVDRSIEWSRNGINLYARIILENSANSISKNEFNFVSIVLTLQFYFWFHNTSHCVYIF